MKPSLPTAFPWPQTPPSAPTAPLAPTVARRWNSKSAQSTHAVCGYCQKTRWCVAATCSRAWARWPSCSTTTARCSFLPQAHHPRWQAALHPDRPPAVQKRRRRVDGRVVAFLEDGTASLGRQTAPTSSPARSTPVASCPKPAVSPGATTAINGRAIALPLQRQCAAGVVCPGRTAQPPPLGQPFDMVELRSADGEVLSIDYGHTRPAWSGALGAAGRPPAAGLKDESAKEEKGRRFNCPHCGAPVQVQLSTTKSPPAVRATA